VRRSRLEALTPDEKERFLPLCPDFVIELASPSDRVSDLQAKMDEYVANGAQLGWLIVPDTRAVYVYRPGAPAQRESDKDVITADPLLPGFVLDLGSLWRLFH
jgi:Uma2 family endonuclease